MVNQYYFSIEESAADGLIVAISPKDYTDTFGGMQNEHLTDELEPIIGNLPFILEEACKGMFSVYDLSKIPKPIPSSEIKNVTNEIIKLGCFEEVSNDFWYE